MPGINVIFKIKQPATNLIIQSETRDGNARDAQPCIPLNPTNKLSTTKEIRKPAKIGLFYYLFHDKLFKIRRCKNCCYINVKFTQTVHTLSVF